jgi:hypothetical protein
MLELNESKEATIIIELNEAIEPIAAQWPSPTQKSMAAITCNTSRPGLFAIQLAKKEVSSSYFHLTKSSYFDRCFTLG